MNLEGETGAWINWISNMHSDRTILVVNCGSSSVKVAAFAADAELRRLWSGAAERIGMASGYFHAHDAAGAVLADDGRQFADHQAAIDAFLDLFMASGQESSVRAFAHRVVHGGPRCDCPVVVNAALEAYLRRLVPLAPLHQPHNLAGIAAARRARPDLPQIACFDTAFHHGLPRLARFTALPRSLEKVGIRRYGFHGLSYEYVLDELRRSNGGKALGERIIVAHLGNGASMAAIREGRSVETTMGFSTLGGLPMETRCGDLDPGILIYLLHEEDMTLPQVQHLLYEESGLLGISGISRNMKDLLARRDAPAAAEAVAFFCYQARKHLGALTAVLGGLDRLVFTGGIGANAPAIRSGICDGLDHLGISIDAGRNARGERVISAGDGTVRVEAFPTDEEEMIARHTQLLLADRSVAKEA